MCGTHTVDCDPNYLGECGCPELAEGGGLCVALSSCGEPCPNGSADCPAGKLCFINTCCGEPTCLIAECPLPSGIASGDGPTWN